MQLRSDHIKEAMEKIRQNIPTVYMIALVSVDGLLMHYWVEGNPAIENLREVYEENPIGPMATTMLSLGERVLRVLRSGEYRFGVLHGDKGTIFEVVLGDKFVLIFGVREIRTIDTTLTILQQWWDDLLALLDVDAPEL